MAISQAQLDSDLTADTQAVTTLITAMSNLLQTYEQKVNELDPDFTTEDTELTTQTNAVNAAVAAYNQSLSSNTQTTVPPTDTTNTGGTSGNAVG